MATKLVLEPVEDGSFFVYPNEYLVKVKSNGKACDGRMKYRRMMALQENNIYHVFFNSKTNLLYDIPDKPTTFSKTPFDFIHPSVLENIMEFMKMPYYKAVHGNNEDNFYIPLMGHGLIYLKIISHPTANTSNFSVATETLFSNLYDNHIYPYESIISEVLLEFIADYFPKALSVTMAGAIHIYDFQWNKLEDECPDLKVFNFMAGVLIRTDGLMRLSEDRILQKLKIAHMGLLLTLNVKQFIQNIVNKRGWGLEAIGGVYLNENKDFATKLFTCNEKWLLKFSLDCWTLDSEHLNGLGNCKLLTSLTLTNCQQMSESILNGIKSCEKLENLRLQGNNTWTSAALENCLQPLPLKNLSVAQIGSFKDNVFRSLLTKYSLRTLTLKITPATNVGINHFIRSNDKLKELHIYMCPMISHWFLKCFMDMGCQNYLEKFSFTASKIRKSNVDNALEKVVTSMGSKFRTYNNLPF